MTREQLDAAHTAILARHYRSIVDNSGRPPQGYLDDLARCHGPGEPDEAAAARADEAGRAIARQAAAGLGQPAAEPGPKRPAPGRRTTTRRPRT